LSSKASNKEFKSLISLLDDPDEEVFNSVFNKLCEYGPIVIPTLEDEWEHNVDEVVQERLENLIHTIQFDYLKSELKIWALNESNNLMKGVLIFNKYFYPDVDDNDIIEKINALKKEIWIELNYQLTPIEQVRVFNLIFFKHQKFHSNLEQLHEPKNNFITYALETKKSNQIGLGILYLILAQQLRMPVYGICLKNHFVVCYVDSDVFHADTSYISAHDILFYINPFNLGAIFNKEQILDYLKKIKAEPQDKYFFPTTNIEIIKELINTAINNYTLQGVKEKVEELLLLKSLLG
jgi:regulator of sirC expression with transglutaminase-like and TPR domain